jgi:adenylosuccinate lyase
MNSAQAFDNPLVTRYAGPAMAALWSPQRKFSTWRRLWVALAEAQHELGLRTEDGSAPRIRPEQLAQLRDHVDDIDFARADHHEARLRHDVMAHIHTYGEICPDARGILHLGATSCYVTDNTDLILLREGLSMLRDRVVTIVDALATFAHKHRDLTTLGWTHFQPAQLTTVGKRACLWCQDFLFDLHEIEHRLSTLRFRGVKGTTGTQASFLALFHGDHAKVLRLEHMVARKMGFNDVYPVTGQTYSRKIDSQVLDVLSGLGQTAHKFGTDLRLLAHEQEIDEPFETEQVGSSAMAYKRNPMRSERMCGLARFVMGLATNTAATAATQWLERTLDDSVNRRLTLPQAFLAADGMLRLALNVSSGMQANADVIARAVERVFPYMATENVMMAATAHGVDRQEAHEVIRQHSHAVTAALKAGAGRNDLLDRLRAEPLFRGLPFDEILARGQFVGRAPEQVDEFIAAEVEPVRRQYPQLLGRTDQVSV